MTRVEAHCHSVSQYSVRLADRLRMSAEDTDRVKCAGLWHDAGRGIALARIDEETRNVVLKPDDYRWPLIKMHPEFGYQAYRHLCRKGAIPYDSDIASAILYHHVDFTGSAGYPAVPFSGFDIPFFARLLRVADTVCAMAEDRRYAPARDWEHISAELRSGRGVLYCPEITDAALDEGLPEEVPHD